MPSAICKICSKLIHWRIGIIKKQQCVCGNKKLHSVAGTYNPDNDSWIYKDRKGLILKIVPRVTENNSDLIA